MLLIIEGYWGGKMKRSKLQIVAILAAALVFGFLGAYAGMTLAGDNGAPLEMADSSDSNGAGTSETKGLSGDMQKIERAFHLIKQNYIEDVEDGQLIEGAIEGMLATLEDRSEERR